MASLNLAGKTSGYVKLQAPDDSSNNPTVTLPTESGELALKSDIGEGGGDYTPEKLVWEDVTAEKSFNTVYENDTDVPRYVQLHVNAPTLGTNIVEFFIDGIRVGVIGSSNNEQGTRTYDTSLFIIPSGSNYELKDTGNFTLTIWNEARMPVAVGTGGKTVAFKAGLSTNQTIEKDTNTKLNLGIATIDTDNALTDGKFKPSVAGYYQVNGSLHQFCSPASTHTVCTIRKNGKSECDGSQVIVSSPNASGRSVVSDVIYLDPENKWTDDDGKEQVGDYLELWGYLSSTGTNVIASSIKRTFLSAVLVSGGSASGGDSIWTEEDGKAVYDGDITVNGVNVGRGKGNIDSNTSVGFQSLDHNQTGLQNTAVGINALNKNITGSNNTAVGRNSLYQAETSSFHTAVGHRAGWKTMQDNTTYLGCYDGSATQKDGIYLSAGPNLYVSWTAPVTRGGFPQMNLVAETDKETGEILKQVKVPDEQMVNARVLETEKAIDKKLAIKDKLIEKLEARLDALEKKLKK